MNLIERAKQLKVDIPAIFLLMKRRETPLLAKVLAGLTLAYVLSPIDLIPDFIPVLGYLDDIILVPALIALTVKCIPKNLFEECKEEAKGMWENGTPKKWYYAVPMVLVWILILWLILRNFL